MIKILSKDQLEKLTTKRLLAYKNKLMDVHDHPDWDYPGGFSKEHPDWQKLYTDVKDVFSKREHVEKK